MLITDTVLSKFCTWALLVNDCNERCSGDVGFSKGLILKRPNSACTSWVMRYDYFEPSFILFYSLQPCSIKSSNTFDCISFGTNLDICRICFLQDPASVPSDPAERTAFLFKCRATLELTQ